MRVLVVGLNYAPEPTGIAPYTTRMATGLQARGHEVRVLTAMPHYPQWRVAPEHRRWSIHEHHDGVGVRRVLHYVPATPDGARRALSEVSFGVRAAASRWHRPDVVLAISPALLSTSLVALRSRLGTRPALGVVVQDIYSVGMRETGSGGGAMARAVVAAERGLMRHADGVAVIHPTFTDEVTRLGCDPSQVTVIRNWTHVSDPGPVDRRATRQRLGWGERDFVVLHAGAMGVKQGLENVVDTAAAARDAAPDLRFVLAGDGGRRAELETRGDGLDNLQFLDPLPAALYAQALRAADVLLVNELPGSGQMAVPSKLTSYFGTGVPVVAAVEAGGTTAYEVNASGAGVVVRPGRPEELLQALRDLRDDPDRARRLGARGPAYSASVLSEANALDAYDVWVHRLAGTRATPPPAVQAVAISGARPAS